MSYTCALDFPIYQDYDTTIVVISPDSRHRSPGFRLALAAARDVQRHTPQTYVAFQSAQANFFNQPVPPDVDLIREGVRLQGGGWRIGRKYRNRPPNS